MREMARAIARGSPAITRSASVAVTGGRSRRETQSPMPAGLRSSRQQLPGDDEPLDLARALADGGELHVAEVFLRRVVLHEAVAAVDLDAVVGHLDGDLARIQFGHRRL